MMPNPALRLRDFARHLVAGDDGTSLEQRLYRALCLVSAILMLVIVTPLNLVEHLSVFLDLTILAFGFASLALYFAAARGFSSPPLFFGLLVLVLNVVWFANGGTNGSIGFYLFAAVAYALIFMRGWQRWTLVTLFVADSLTLLVVEYRFPALVIPFESPFARLLDLATGIVVASIACMVMLWAVLAGYDAERKKEVQLGRQLRELLELNRLRTQELEETLAEVNTLRGLLPICMSCKNVRDDAGLWTQVEQYVSRHSLAEFSHSLCPDCMRRLYPDDADAVLRDMQGR
jgi:hypothetical protein